MTRVIALPCVCNRHWSSAGGRTARRVRRRQVGLCNGELPSIAWPTIKLDLLGQDAVMWSVPPCSNRPGPFEGVLGRRSCRRRPRCLATCLASRAGVGWGLCGTRGRGDEAFPHGLALCCSAPRLNCRCRRRTANAADVWVRTLASTPRSACPCLRSVARQAPAVVSPAIPAGCPAPSQEHKPRAPSKCWPTSAHPPRRHARYTSRGRCPVASTEHQGGGPGADSAQAKARRLPWLSVHPDRPASESVTRPKY